MLSSVLYTSNEQLPVPKIVFSDILIFFDAYSRAFRFTRAGVGDGCCVRIWNSREQCETDGEMKPIKISLPADPFEMFAIPVC